MKMRILLAALFAVLPAGTGLAAPQKPVTLKNGQLQQIQPGDTLDASQAINLPLATGVTGTLPVANAPVGYSSVVYAKDNGVKCDGATNDTAAINSVLSANVGKRIVLPSGICIYNGGGVLGNGTLLTAASRNATILLVNVAAPSQLLTVSGYEAGIKDVSIQANVTQTGGSWLLLSGVGSYVKDFSITGYYNAVTMTGPTASISYGRLLNAAAGGTAILAAGGDTSQLIDNVVAGGDAVNQSRACIEVVNIALTISNTSCLQHGVGLLVDPGNGNVVASLDVHDSFFDFSKTANISIAPTGTGSVVRSRFSNLWAGDGYADGVRIFNLGTGLVEGLHFIDLHAVVNAGSGVTTNGLVRDLSFLGGEFGQNTFGFYLASGASAINITGAHIGAFGGLTGNTQWGVVASSGVTNLNMVNNQFGGNSAGDVSDGTGSVPKNIIGNIGSGISTQITGVLPTGNLPIGTSGSTVPILSGVNTWSQQQTFTAAIQGGATLPTDKNFANPSEQAAIHRLNDKLFVSGATESDGSYPNVVKDWLSTFQSSLTGAYGGGALEGTGIASGLFVLNNKSPEMGAAFVAGAHTKYFTNPYTNALANNSFCIHDNPTYGASCWAFYGEPHLNSSAGGQAVGMEISPRAIVATTPQDPYTLGTLQVFQATCGAGVTDTGNRCSSAFIVSANPTKFSSGIVSYSGVNGRAVALTDGSTYAPFISMVPSDELVWYGSAATPTTRIVSTVDSSHLSSAVTWLNDNNGLAILNNSGGLVAQSNPAARTFNIRQFSGSMAFNVTGGMQLTGQTFSTLPACNSSSAGSQGFVTDAATAITVWNQAVTAGGGTTKTSVTCNGSAWYSTDAIRDVPAALPCWDVRQSGVKWDGVTNDTSAMVTAITAAIAAKGSASGVCIQLPPGKGILGQVNLPNWGDGLRIKGAGVGATVIQPASLTSSMWVTPTNAGMNVSLEFSDFEIVPSGQPTAGTTFDISNVSGVKIHDIRQNKGYAFAKFGSNANKGDNNVFVTNNILRNFLGAPVITLDNGYDFYTWGNAFDMDIANYGCSSDIDYACQPNSFLTAHNWGGIFLGQDDPIHCGSCFYFDANYSGAIIQGIMATNEQADTCAGVGYYLHAASGAQIQGFAGSIRASSCGDSGIKVNEDSGGHIYQMTLGTVHTINNGKHGIEFLSFNSSASITELWSAANSTYGNSNTYSNVAFTGGSGPVSITNAHLGGGAVGLSEPAKYNLDIGSGYSGRIAINGGIFGSTVTGQYNNLGSGLLTISNAPGINPVAAGTVSPGASPWTYTASISPTHINLAGGTVSNVTIGGTSVCTSTPCSLTLVPGSAMVVTYSSAPTVLVSKD